MAAKDFLHDDRAARPTILALVIGVHIAALFIATVEQYRRVRDQPAPARSKLILVLPDWDDSGLLIIPDARPLGVPVTAPRPPDLAPVQTPVAGASDPSAAQPDWKQSGAAAAADAAAKAAADAARQRSYRAFGPQPADPRMKAPRWPFKPPPRHQFGELGEDPLENPVLWLNENCYVKMQDPQGPEPGDPFAGVDMTLCAFAVGKSKARGDLFEHLRKPAPVP